MNFQKCLILGLLSFITSVSAFAEEIIHYDNQPVTIMLTVGDERTVQFQDNVQVGTTRAQEVKNLFRQQNASGAVHFLAYRPFQNERVQIKRISDGRIILIDLTAVERERDDDPRENVVLYMPGENSVNGITPEQQVSQLKVPKASPVTLTRYAAQRFYAPTRLHVDVPGIYADSVGGLANKPFRLFKGKLSLTTEAKALEGFQAGRYHLAAVLITNTSPDSVTLDYMSLNVPFTHATFQHHGLAPAGQPGDRTMLYLINDRPIQETLVPWDFYRLASVAEESAE